MSGRPGQQHFWRYKVCARCSQPTRPEAWAAAELSLVPQARIGHWPRPERRGRP